MTNAAIIFANIPADFKVPDYVEADSVITDAGSSQTVLTASDGTEYILAEDCDIFPYLTRNIVTLDDLTQGKRWSYGRGDDNTATKSWYLQNNPIKKNQDLPEMAGCLILFLLISALYADFIKFFQNIINSCFFFFCSALSIMALP